MLDSLIFITDIVPVSAGMYAFVLGILVFAGATIAGFFYYLSKGKAAPIKSEIASEEKAEGAKETEIG